jgi:hypothetical protein
MQQEEPAAEGEGALPPQRNSRLVDLLVLGIIMVILLGGIGKAFSDSDLFAQPRAQVAASVEGCPEGGCVKPPDEVCVGRPVKAIVGVDGSRLYYTGEHPGYGGIIAIHVERGDRWFCTAGGAESGGFVAAP